MLTILTSTHATYIPVIWTYSRQYSIEHVFGIPHHCNTIICMVCSKVVMLFSQAHKEFAGIKCRQASQCSTGWTATTHTVLVSEFNYIACFDIWSICTSVTALYSLLQCQLQSTHHWWTGEALSWTTELHQVTKTWVSTTSLEHSHNYTSSLHNRLRGCELDGNAGYQLVKILVGLKELEQLE